MNSRKQAGIKVKLQVLSALIAAAAVAGAILFVHAAIIGSIFVRAA